MTVSIVDVLREQKRQAVTGDTQYFIAPKWAFRVVSPKPNRGPCGPTGDALFPLPINPDRFEYSLPFANELTPQQEGGVVVEDTGVVIGTITMSGTTGFKLRRQKTAFHGGGQTRFTGFLPSVGSVFGQDVSGQMAFWILANKCFEGYSTLKADPETSGGTRMELFVPKETLALEVVPKTFGLTRSANSERVTYRYNITLEVIGEAEPIDLSALEDEEDIFESILDSITTMRDTLGQIAAVVDDVTAMVDSLRRTWQGLSGFLDDLATITNSCSAFVEGVKSFVSVPRSFMQSFASLAEDASELFSDTATLPADVGQSFAQLGDYANTLIVASRDHFRGAWEDVAEAYNTRATPRYDISRTNPGERDEIAQRASDGASSDGSLTPSQVYGGTFQPGDERRARLSAATSRLKSRDYTGFSEIPVGQGDTLASIAARTLGDARKWPDLALVNNLSPPFITTGPKLPGTLQPGSRIIIPVNKPVRPAQVLTTGDPDVGASQANAHLGVDYEYVQTEDGSWGWKIDAAHGAVDGTRAAGIGNLAQALGSRLRTERGTNLLYPGLGLPRLIGASQLESPAPEINLRVRQQILADPRIDRLESASFSVVNDAVEVEIKAQPVGATTPRTISQTLT
ncbi:MAG: LysM peptidoglycan-binding domain-containing protein [Gammaproteobacteria bacterium]|nr:LysM peptidoglycan-binding domain-containing protein [Gammaproteobacteria bacterium]